MHSLLLNASRCAIWDDTRGSFGKFIITSAIYPVDYRYNLMSRLTSVAKMESALMFLKGLALTRNKCFKTVINFL